MSRNFAMLLGVVLLVVGIWGWATGGHAHNLMCFGVNMNHNLVHLLSGALALGCALGSGRYARLYLMVFGTVYGLVAVLGFLSVGTVVEMLNLNMADNLLHIAIAAACLWVGSQDKGGAAAAA
ncbi:MAG: DUF4383 domain-containing protein [Candidatus Eisenbacteria bacterium]